jgi:eukaryotic-like serine/threonine-protein kinase
MAHPLATNKQGAFMQMPLLNRRYLLLSRLGKGGMGVVYKAADTFLGNRPIAIKEMRQSQLSLQDVARASAAFRQEAVLLASLSHQNLPRIYDHFSEQGNSYLVMEFINGDTLADILRQAGGQGLLVEEVLLIAEQLCAVLDYLHTHQPPVIFRDIKPGNVMITYSGDHLYLIDFGIARLFKPAQLRDTLVSGTPGYAPPEQFGGSTNERSDIFSFGVTLHQLLTGVDPTHTQAPFYFPPVHRFNPQVPPPLEKLIAQMVEIDPEKRPPSVLVVRRELQGIRQELLRGTLAPSLTPSGKMVVPTTAGAAIGTTLHICQRHTDSVQALAWSPDGKYLATSGRDKLVHIWDTTTGLKKMTYAKHSTYVYGLAWSPDGRRIISTSFATVHIWDALTGENVVVYRDHSLWVYTGAWSSDGRYVATGGAEGEVHFWTDVSGNNIYKYLASSRVVKAVAWSRTVGSIKIVVGCEDAIAHSWDAATGNTPLIYKGHSKEITSVAWSPDDLQIASGSRDMTVQIWDAHQGNTLYTYRGHSKEVYTVAWSPNGKFIASAGEDKTIRIWDAVTGNTTYIHPCHTNAVCAIAWSPEGKRIASASDDKTVRIWQAS